MSRMNPETFRNLYADMLGGIDPLSNKEGLLVVGKTGSGKSTTINYLLNLVIQKAAGYTTLNPKFKAAGGAVIGNRMESQTLLPSAYDFKVGESDTGLSLIDTAGLGDTRGLEVSLVVSLAIKRISELARIKGVVMVLQQHHFSKDRGIQLVEAFELISQMTTEFTPKTFMFCVTGLPTLSEDEVAGVKDELIGKLIEAANILDDRLANASTPEEKERLKKVAAAFRSCMTVDNLFIINDLENRAQQENVRNAFYERTKVMPGLQKPLDLALTRELSLELQRWGAGIARDANALLTQRKEIYTQLNETGRKLEELTHLHAALDRAVAQHKKASVLLGSATQTQRTNELELMALQERAHEMVLKRVGQPIRVPNVGSGIGGRISKHIVLKEGPRFDHLDIPMDAKILEQNLSKGSFDVNVEYTLNGTETNPFELGVDVVYRMSSLPEYQTALLNAKERLEEHGQAIVVAQRQQAESSYEIEQWQAKIYKMAEALALPVRSEDPVEKLLLELGKKLTELSAQLCTIKDRRIVIDKDFVQQRDNFEFLDEVARHAGLEKLDDDVRKFRQLYAESKSMDAIESNQERHDVSDRVVRLKSPTGSGASMWGRGAFVVDTQKHRGAVNESITLQSFGV